MLPIGTDTSRLNEHYIQYLYLVSFAHRCQCDVPGKRAGRKLVEWNTVSVCRFVFVARAYIHP